MTSSVEFSEELAKPAYTPPPTFVRIGQAEVALSKIIKIQIHHFELISHKTFGENYCAEGWIEIFILNREETLTLFKQEGYDLFLYFLGLYGIEDPSGKYHEGTIYP